MADKTGDLARQMGSAPKGETTAKAFPFVLERFVMPGKAAEPFPKDASGNVTKRVAYAIVRLRGTEFFLQASVYHVTPESGKARVRLAMPSSGKGFPRPVFTTDDPATQDAYNTWRAETAKAYVAWSKQLKQDHGADTSQSIDVEVD